MNTKLWLAYRVLYVAHGLFPIIVGIDKFFNYLAPNWLIYLNLAIPVNLNISPTVFMKSMGIVEIFCGLLILYKPTIGAYVNTILLILISVNLITIGLLSPASTYVITQYDTALRAMTMAAGSFALAMLSQQLDHKKSD